jgi:tungstate transport system substrate-binding protein
MTDDPTRRAFLKVTTATALVSVLPAIAACVGRSGAAVSGQASGAVASAPPPPVASSPPVSEEAARDAGAIPSEPVNPKKLRVVSVPTAVEGNVLPLLIADFEKASGLEVTLEATDEPFEVARAGKADIAVSHYGHRHVEEFVLDGLGEWPRTLFSNQMALIGPPSDPAKVRGLLDAVEAFRRIAAKKAAFVLNASDGGRYLADVLWHAAGRPNKDGWFVDEGLKNAEVVRFAATKRAYTLWGLTPFVRTDKEAHVDLEPLVLADPLLQRILVSTIVKSSRLPGANSVAAHAFQTHLLAPATQATIRDVRYPGATRALWVPAGRHNRTGVLIRGE